MRASIGRFALLAALGVSAVVITGFAQAPGKVSVILEANWRTALEPLVTEFNASSKTAQIEVTWGGDQAKLIAVVVDDEIGIQANRFAVNS